MTTKTTNFLIQKGMKFDNLPSTLFLCLEVYRLLLPHINVILELALYKGSKKSPKYTRFQDFITGLSLNPRDHKELSFVT